SSPVTVTPSNGSSPIWFLSTPDTLSPSCFSEAIAVFEPCGELIVTSQSPATFTCANSGPATRRNTPTNVHFARCIDRLLSLLVCGAAGLERSFAQVADGRRAVDRVAFQLAFERDVDQLAVLGNAPDDRHAIAVEPAVDLVLAVLVGDDAGQMRAALDDVHVDGLRAARHHELHAPLTGRARGRWRSGGHARRKRQQEQENRGQRHHVRDSHSTFDSRAPAAGRFPPPRSDERRPARRRTPRQTPTPAG